MLELARSNDSEPRCQSIPGGAKRLNFCRRYPELVKQIAKGFKLAIENCQKDFANQR